MSSTTGIQNLLVNVFRPVYTYEPTATLFTPKLEMSNIDTYSGNAITVFNASIGDTASNMYVGTGAGNPYTTLNACRNNVALGVFAGAGISNVSNSVYVGYNVAPSALNSTSVVAIGANATGGTASNVTIGTSATGAGSSNVYIGAGVSGSNGSNNVYLGAGTTGTGSSNILIGPGISDASSSSFRVGSNYLYGQIADKWLGIGQPSATDTAVKLDVSGNLYVKGEQGINIVPDRTLDVNGTFRVQDGTGTLNYAGGILESTNGYVSVKSSASIPVGATTIATVRRGIIHVSAVSLNTTHRAAYIYFAWTTSNVTTLASSINGDTDIAISSTDIQISNLNTTKTYSYTVTYLPT